MKANYRADRTAWLAVVWQNGKQVAAKWFCESDRYVAARWITQERLKVSQSLADTCATLREWNKSTKSWEK